VRQRPRQRLWSANTAMHLSRRRNVLFFAEKTLRPGDGERSKDRKTKPRPWEGLPETLTSVDCHILNFSDWLPRSAKAFQQCENNRAMLSAR
jgi:hypothetical protein